MVKILFDQGTPVPLRRYLTGHNISTVFELGWSQLVNGELIARAEGGFDALVTTDKNLRYQQNLAGRKLSILILPFGSWPKLQTRLADIKAAVDALRPGDFVEL